MLVRDFGGIVFAVLRDWSGDTRIALTRDRSGPALDRFTADTDTGDHITASGHAGVSDRGEPTVFVTSWQPTGKCLRPLPDKRRGLADPEARLRMRYLDLAAGPAARDVVRARSPAVQAVRQGLLARGCLEVGTPVLQQIHGGANARPSTRRTPTTT
jgi:lysyl-tRNA synthetase class 2